MNHKWNEHDECKTCGITRFKKTTRLLMAIEGSKSYYKYTNGYVYTDGYKEWTLRPECKQRQTFDNQ